MQASDLPRSETRLIAPRVLRSYAEGLGWSKVDGVNGFISAYSSPRERNRQLIVPLDEKLDDYADRTAEAVVRLAEFEGRPAREVLDQLLSPPADVLSFQICNPATEAGSIPLEQGEAAIDGVRTGLLAVAHSVEKPQAYYPRLGRDIAKQFLNRCRMTTGRGSFVLSVACLLDQDPALTGIESEPFTRRVTTLFIDTLAALASASRLSDATPLTDSAKSPGVSANLCESLLQLWPSGDRAHVTVSAIWSRTRLPRKRNAVETVRLDQEVFELAEVLAPRLRSQPQPDIGWFFGFVEELRGEAPTHEPRPSGEVRLKLHLKDEEFRVKADLTADEYAIAAQAHLNSQPIGLRGELHRMPRLSRVEKVTQFQLIGLTGVSDS